MRLSSMTGPFVRAAVPLAVLAAALPVSAADFPDHEIKAVCNFPAGSGADVFVRYFSAKLSALAGKPVVVENRGGALGNIGTASVAKAKADGYTILIAPGSSTMAAASHTFKSLPFDPVKDFTPVTTLARLGFVVAVDAKSPVKTLAELTAHLKAKQGKAIFGISANTGLVSAELYKKVAGVQATKAQYREMGTLMNDMLAGSLDFTVGDPVWAVEQVRSGKIRALAVTSAVRLSGLPDVPTMKEAGLPDFGELTAWWAVFVPANTPAPVVAKLEGWFNQIAASEDTKKFLNNLGSEPYPGNATMLKELLASDIKKWGEYVKLAGLTPQ